MSTGMAPKPTIGLAGAEAARRLLTEGYNELPSAKRKGLAALALEVVSEPMFLLLVACGLIYLLLGDLHEALMLLGFVFVVMGITFIQERKTERALEALRDLSSPRALVIRDGQQVRIPGREVVRGDVLLLSEGDRVPADAVVLGAYNLSIDESLLTGESVPVRKTAATAELPLGAPGGDDLPFVYSGTLVVQGQGIAVVQGTGAQTEIGKIGKALQTMEASQTPLQRETDRLVRRVAVFGLALCCLVVLVYGLTRGNWLGGLLAGITLAMAMVPEEFPVVLTIFLALGAWRLSQRRVLTRRMPAVETLGAATVLCVDKTGTLTVNRMTVGQLYAAGSLWRAGDAAAQALPEEFHALVETAILACKQQPTDPMEKALVDLGDAALAETEHLHKEWTLTEEYPLSRELLALTHVWKSPGGEDFIVAAKGAPEAIADLCHLDQATWADLSRRLEAMAEEGLRVLGVARATSQALPAGQHDFDFEFLGLVGLADPVRETVPAAVRECCSAGVRVVMITGDYPGTARSIAREIGLTAPDQVITGPELAEMDDTVLRERVRTVNVFARMVPEQKLRLVNALKMGGEVVAMTGDGVNDAPALKAAHIGVAMGARGTDVAREAAAIVLLDDDFSSIVGAVRQGRRIFDNLKKAIAYILAIHVPIAGLSLIPVLLKWPLILYPVHIVFLELIIDPACSVVFEAEPEEAGVMHRPPRDPREPLFSRRVLGLSVLQGATVLLVTLAVYALSLYRLGLGENESRTLAFTALIVANLGLILANRSWSQTILQTLRTPNAALWWVVGGATAFLSLSLNLPVLRRVLHLAPLAWGDVAVSLAAGVVGILWFEALKVRRPKPGAVSDR
ncbi:MAG: cation-translocating P-type ATPase [Chitinophagales bacterium]